MIALKIKEAAMSHDEEPAPRDDEEPAGFSSPPCFAHELDPAYVDPLVGAELTRLVDTILDMDGTVVRRLDEALPRIADDTIHAALSGIRSSHRASLDTATALLVRLGGR